MDQINNRESLAQRLLHGARDLVWQDDPMSRPTEATEARDPAIGAAEVRPTPAVAAGTSAAAPNGMTADLLSLVMSRPTAYSALSEAITALAEIPMDEAMRYRSAFAVLKQTQQRTVEQIAQAIDVHLGLLESERTRFAAQSQNAEQEGITARVTEMAALNASVEETNRQIAAVRAECEARIRKMNEDMTAKQQRARELSRETEEKKQAIAQTKRNFEAAMEAVKTRLAGEKNKVQMYLC
jgi:vacuolar-type H+-ATPase subunit I/STV1